MTRPSDNQPADPDFVDRVRRSFEGQSVMGLIGARLNAVEPGKVAISLPFRPDLGQQDGFVHAGVLATIADSACGYAALSLMPSDKRVLSVEFKQNMLAPATGEMIVAEASVIRRGRTLTVVGADVYSVTGETRKLIATMLATMIAVGGESG